MVTKGQLLERPVIIPARDGQCLDGIYLRGEAPGLVIASPLPLAGGSMANPLGNELAYAAALTGRASLRLDYRGVAASEGTASNDLGAASEDLQAGIDFLLESTRGKTVALGGVGSGCWAALRAAIDDPRVDRLVLVSPPRAEPVPDGVPAYAELQRPLLVIVGEDDVTADPTLERALAAGHGRVKVLHGATTGLREALGTVARLIPPFLGAERRGTDEAPPPDEQGRLPGGGASRGPA